MGLFDERNLFEFADPEYPDERLIACRNPQLAKRRAHKRQALMEATRLELDKIRDRVARGALEGAAAIGVKLGRVLDKYKVGKHFELAITDTAVNYQMPRTAGRRGSRARWHLRHPHRLTQKADVRARGGAQLQGAHPSRAGVPFLENRGPEDPPHPSPTREPRPRPHLPVHAELLRRVAHARGLAPMLFADEDQAAKAKRDPVAPAKRSSAALEKVHTHIIEDGTPAQSLRTLIAELATLVRNTCRMPGDLEHPATFDILTTPTTLQRRAFELIDQITV